MRIVDCSAVHSLALTAPTSRAFATGRSRRYAQPCKRAPPHRSLPLVARSLPLKVTGPSGDPIRPAIQGLGRRRERVPLRQAAVLSLAAFELETFSHCQHRSTLRPTRLRVGALLRPVIPHSAFRIPHWATPASMACAAPPLRPGARKLASSLRTSVSCARTQSIRRAYHGGDVHDRRVFSHSSLQRDRNTALVLQPSPVTRGRDPLGCALFRRE